MHYFQSQTRGSLQRQGPSTRDRQWINEVLLPARLQASSPCFLAKKEQGIQKPAALQRTRPAPAFPVNGPSLCIYVKRAGMTGFLLLCCDQPSLLSLNAPSPIWAAAVLVETRQAGDAAPPALCCQALLPQGGRGKLPSCDRIFSSGGHPEGGRGRGGRACAGPGLGYGGAALPLLSAVTPHATGSLRLFSPIFRPRYTFWP